MADTQHRAEPKFAGDIPSAPSEPRARTLRVPAMRALAVLRVMFGLTFLWAFLDKTFGLTYATSSSDAWIDGGHPTFGYLQIATGPFEDMYKNIAGDAWADWLFMLGLLGIGVTLTLGIGMRVGAACGAAMYVLMWTVVLPPEQNPVLDEHLLGAVTMIVLALTFAGETWGFGRMWSRMPLVRRFPILR